jgi:hypothetical protein
MFLQKYLYPSIKIKLRILYNTIQEYMNNILDTMYTHTIEIQIHVKFLTDGPL